MAAPGHHEGQAEMRSRKGACCAHEARQACNPIHLAWQCMRQTGMRCVAHSRVGCPLHRLLEAAQPVRTKRVPWLAARTPALACLRRRRRWNCRVSKMRVEAGSKRKAPWMGSCCFGGGREGCAGCVSLRCAKEEAGSGRKRPGWGLLGGMEHARGRMGN